MVVFVREKNTNSYQEKKVDQDGLWKKVIEELFEDFLQFFMPELYDDVDFTHEVEFLDKELYQEVVDEKKGRRHADQLVKVQLKNGGQQWILVHVEVQSSKETAFSKRMFQYFYRIYDRHEEKVVTLAIHTSRENIGEMKYFEYNYFGTALHYSYNNYRTEDYLDTELERSDNIFSGVVLAAKAMHKTKGKIEERYHFKRKLMRELIRSKKYSRPAIVATIYFIDYLLQLPKEETRKLGQEIGPEIRKERGIMELYNEENAPPTVYNSFAEQLDRGFARGIEQGLEQGISLEKQNIAKKLFSEKMPLEMIAHVTDLSMDELKAIQEAIEE